MVCVSCPHRPTQGLQLPPCTSTVYVKNFYKFVTNVVLFSSLAIAILGILQSWSILDCCIHIYCPYCFDMVWCRARSIRCHGCLRGTGTLVKHLLSLRNTAMRI